MPYDPTIDQTRRTGAGTVDNPLTDVQINDLASQGIREGDTVPGKGVLSPLGTFSNTPTPDINSELNRIKTEGLRIQDILNQRAADEQTIGQSFNSPEFDQGTEYIDTNLTDKEIRDIERRQLRLFQKEIDATNQVYDQLLNEARMEGQGRLGSQRAMAARGGLLGSDFGASQKQKVQAFNTDVNRAIQAERQAKIGTIMGNVRQAVLDEKTEKRQAKQQGAENYIEWLKGEATRKQNNINLAATAMLTQGLNPAEMDENELGAIAQEVGTTVENLVFQYQQLASQQATGDQFTLSAGEQRFDAQGNLIAEGPASAKDFGTIYSTGKGLVRVNPETGQPELIFATGSGGGGGSTGETFKSGGATFSGTEVASWQNTLNSSRNESGYVDSNKYMEGLTSWTNDNGLEEDYFKIYPPDEYIDPSDTSIPKRIRDKANKSSSGTIMINGVPLNVENTVIAEEESGPITEEDTGFWSKLFGG